MNLGEYIRTARNIHAHIYGEDSVYNEVNVNLWIFTARQVTKELEAVNFQETLKQLREIPINLLTQLNPTRNEENN